MTLQQIYSRIPAVACKGLCWEACGPIPAFTNEPIVALTEDRHVLGGVVPPSVTIADSATLTCPHLVDNRCSQHEQRPAICRMYGAAIGMECGHGCVPDRWLSRKEGLQILRQVCSVDG